MPIKEVPELSLTQEIEITPYIPTFQETINGMLAKLENKPSKVPPPYASIMAELDVAREKYGIPISVIEYLKKESVKVKTKAPYRAPCGHTYGIDHYEHFSVPERILISPTKKPGYIQPDPNVPVWIKMVGEVFSHSETIPTKTEENDPFSYYTQQPTRRF